MKPSSSWKLVMYSFQKDDAFWTSPNMLRERWSIGIYHEPHTKVYENRCPIYAWKEWTVSTLTLLSDSTHIHIWMEISQNMMVSFFLLLKNQYKLKRQNTFIIIIDDFACFHQRSLKMWGFFINIMASDLPNKKLSTSHDKTKLKVAGQPSLWRASLMTMIYSETEASWKNQVREIWLTLK